MARIAIPLAADFEDSEFTIPYDEARKAGHEVVVFGAKAGEKVAGKRGKAKVKIQESASDLNPMDFDALVIPGGYSPDHLRLDDSVVDFVREFADSNKLIAAVCHGPHLLIEAEAVQGRQLTSWPSVRKPGECRRDLGRSGSRRRRQPDHVAQARRLGSLQPRASGGVAGGVDL